MVSANLKQSCNCPVQVPLARSPVCVRWPLRWLSGILCPSQPWSANTIHPERLRSLGPYIRRSYRPFAFSPWIPSCLGRNPRRRSGHRVVVRSCDRPNPHAALHTKACGLSGLRHLPTLTTHSTQIAYSNRHRSHQTGGCPWLLLTTSNLYHPPSALLLISSLLLAPMRNHTGFTRPALRLLRIWPLGDHTLTSQALASLSAS